MSSNLFTQLSENLNTLDDVRLLQKELAEVRQGIYGNGKKGLKTILKEQVRANIAEILAPQLGSNPQQAVDELDSELKQLPILRLNIAFHPTQSSIEKIVGWLKANTDQHWILDLVINPAVGAGAILEVNGFYRNYSYQEKMTAAITQATQQLMKQIIV